MDEKHQTTGKQVKNLLTALFILIAVVFLLLLGPAFVSTTMPNNSYMIEITGLGGLTVNGTATVMVPVPANAEGDLAISEEVLTGGRVFGWQAEVRETLYGKMLAFTTMDGYAPSIFVSFGEFEKKGEPRLLAPVLATPENTSAAEFTQASGGTYTTVVFLDGFVPPPEGAAPISFNLRYQGDGGMKHLVKENTWTATVNATVPGTESGYIPVSAEYWVAAGGIGL